MYARRYFLYCTSANEASAEALLAKFGLTFDKHDAIQDGVTEYGFSAEQRAIESIKSEILNGSVKVYLTDTKLPISGSIGTVSVDFTDSYIKIASTDGTTGNVAFLKVDSSGRVYQAPPSTILDGTLTTSGSSAVAIASSTSCVEVTIQASHDNADYVLYGNATTQNNRLYAGDSVTLKIDNLSKVYVKRPSSTNVTVTYAGSA